MKTNSILGSQWSILQIEICLINTPSGFAASRHFELIKAACHQLSHL